MVRHSAKIRPLVTRGIEVFDSPYIKLLISAPSFSNNLCFAEFSFRALLTYRYLHTYYYLRQSCLHLYHPV